MSTVCQPRTTGMYRISAAVSRRQPASTGEYSYIALFSPIRFDIFRPGIDTVERGRAGLNRVQPRPTGPYRIYTVSRWDLGFMVLSDLFFFFRRQGFRMITFDCQAEPFQNFGRSWVMVIGKSVLKKSVLKKMCREQNL